MMETSLAMMGDQAHEISKMGTTEQVVMRQTQIHA